MSDELLVLGALFLFSQGSMAPSGSTPTPASPSPSPSPPHLPSLSSINPNDPNAFQVVDIPGVSGRNFFESPANLQQALDWLGSNYSLPAGAAHVAPYSGFLAPYGAVITFEGRPDLRLLIE